MFRQVGSPGQHTEQQRVAKQHKIAPWRHWPAQHHSARLFERTCANGNGLDEVLELTVQDQLHYICQNVRPIKM